MTGRTFKARYTDHKYSFNQRKDKQTALSKYIWKLKDRGLNYKISWSIKTKGFKFSSGSRQCDLCLSEKHAILHHKKPEEILNKRHELLNGCKHKGDFLLESCKPEDFIPPWAINRASWICRWPQIYSNFIVNYSFFSHINGNIILHW